MGSRYKIFIGLMFVILVPVFAYFMWQGVKSSASRRPDQIMKDLSQDPLSDPTVTPSTSQSASGQVAGAQKQAVPAQSPLAGMPTNQQNIPASSPNPLDSSSSSSNTPNENQNKSSSDSSAVKNSDQNYENKTLGISFDYPQGASVTQINPSLLSITNAGKTWKMRLYENKDKTDIETWFKKNFSLKDDPNCTFLSAVVNVGSYDGKLVSTDTAVTNGKCGDAGNYAQNSDKSKIVRVYLGDETQDNVNKILKSFKFL